MEKLNLNNEKVGFLFDLDGVLIDSEREYTRIWQEIDRRYPTGVENFAIRIKGQTLPEILDTYFPKDIHEEVIDLLNEKEQKMHYEMLPGAQEMLAGLRERNLPRALVTSSNDYKMRHLREELPHLESCFDTIITADRITRSKPDPEGYLTAAAAIGIDPRRCVVFEDSAQGVKAGNAAGCLTVGLTTTLPESAIAPWCDRIISTLADVTVDEIAGQLRRR